MGERSLAQETGSDRIASDRIASNEEASGAELAAQRADEVLATQVDRSTTAPQINLLELLTRGGLLYVTPRVTGRAYITGFHQFVLDPDDPFPAGYRVGSQA